MTNSESAIYFALFLKHSNKNFDVSTMNSGDMSIEIFLFKTGVLLVDSVEKV